MRMVMNAVFVHDVRSPCSADVNHVRVSLESMIQGYLGKPTDAPAWLARPMPDITGRIFGQRCRITNDGFSDGKHARQRTV